MVAYEGRSMPRCQFGWISPSHEINNEYERIVDELGHCHFVIDNAAIDYGYESMDEMRPLYSWRDSILSDLKEYRR
jgi:hypothetical protein